MEKDNRKIVQKVDRIINEIQLNELNLISVSWIARQCWITENKLSKLYKKYRSIKLYHKIRQHKLETAFQLISHERDINIYQIANIVGYEDSEYFSRIFKRHYKKTPREVRDSCSARLIG